MAADLSKGRLPARALALPHCVCHLGHIGLMSVPLMNCVCGPETNCMACSEGGSCGRELGEL